jgi:hypothetical protein
VRPLKTSWNDLNWVPTFPFAKRFMGERLFGGVRAVMSSVIMFILGFFYVVRDSYLVLRGFSSSARKSRSLSKYSYFFFAMFDAL